jgi:hypothetical protein
MVGQRPRVDAALAGISGHGGGREHPVGDVGMAVEVDFHDRRSKAMSVSISAA